MRTFNCVSLEYFREYELLIWSIKNTGMPNFCLKGLEEFQEFIPWVKEYFSHPEPFDLRKMEILSQAQFRKAKVLA